MESQQSLRYFAGFSPETVVSFTTVGTTQWTAPETMRIKVLVVGGGGGGGYDGGGGGGGGGVLIDNFFQVQGGTTYTVCSQYFEAGKVKSCSCGLYLTRMKHFRSLLAKEVNLLRDTMPMAVTANPPRSK